MSNLLAESPFLIAGLGNPGREYRFNRHNIGFMAVDHIAANMGKFSKKVQSKTIINIGMYEGFKIILAKPQTFMNLSGQALSGLLRFYKIPLDRFIVIYDDLDIPFGTIRIRPGGGAGGHKGMSSIIQQLNSNQFARVRLGIGRPPGQMDPSDYVLQNFSAQDSDLLIHILDQTYQVIKTWLSDGISTAMNLYNGPYQKD